MGGHNHIQLLGGRVKTCQVYSEKLCRAITVGIRDELVSIGTIEVTTGDMLNVSQGNIDAE